MQKSVPKYCSPKLGWTTIAQRFPKACSEERKKSLRVHYDKAKQKEKTKILQVFGYLGVL